MRGAERRAAIVRAVLPVFARHGFARTTTRQLAQAAGVSEALLYKHFPSKQSLYAEIQRCGCQGAELALEKIGGLPPSTSALVHLIYFLMRSLAFGPGKDPTAWQTRHRLALNSCLEDGAFSRQLLEKYFACCLPMVEDSWRAARAAGDLRPGSLRHRHLLLFLHHLGSMIAVTHLPDRPVAPYEGSKLDLLDQAVRFVLRGIGLTEEAITAHYRPRTLSAFFGFKDPG